jgi:hypothetical protein
MLTLRERLTEIGKKLQVGMKPSDKERVPEPSRSVASTAAKTDQDIFLDRIERIRGTRPDPSADVYGQNPAWKSRVWQDQETLKKAGLTVADLSPGLIEWSGEADPYSPWHVPSAKQRLFFSDAYPGQVAHERRDAKLYVTGIGTSETDALNNATDQFLRWMGMDPNEKVYKPGDVPIPWPSDIGGGPEPVSLLDPEQKDKGPVLPDWEMAEGEEMLFPDYTYSEWFKEHTNIAVTDEPDATFDTLGTTTQKRAVSEKNGIFFVVVEVPEKFPSGTNIPGLTEPIPYEGTDPSRTGKPVLEDPFPATFDWPIRKREAQGLPRRPYETEGYARAEDDTPPFLDPSPVDSSSEYYADIGSPPAEGLIGGPGAIASMMYTKQAGDEDPKREWVSQALPVPQPEPVPKPVAVQPPGMTAVRASTVGGQPQQIVQKAGMELLKQGGKLTPETQQQNLVNRVQNIGMALRDNIPAAAPATTMAAPVQAPVIPGPAASQPTIGKFGFQHAKKQPFYNLLNLAKGNPGMADFAFNQAKKMWDQFDQEGLIPSSSTFSDHVLRRGVPIKTFTNWAMDRPEYHQAVPALTGRILQT